MTRKSQCICPKEKTSGLKVSVYRGTIVTTSPSIQEVKAVEEMTLFLAPQALMSASELS